MDGQTYSDYRERLHNYRHPRPMPHLQPPTHPPLLCQRARQCRWSRVRGYHRSSCCCVTPRGSSLSSTPRIPRTLITSDRKKTFTSDPRTVAFNNRFICWWYRKKCFLTCYRHAIDICYNPPSWYAWQAVLYGHVKKATVETGII